MKKYELIPVFDRRKSFYGKAVVMEYQNGAKVLKSYDTEVAVILPDGSFSRLWNGYSSTTLRHVNEFRKQNGFPGINKTEWLLLQIEKWNIVNVIKAVAV